MGVLQCRVDLIVEGLTLVVFMAIIQSVNWGATEKGVAYNTHYTNISLLPPSVNILSHENIPLYSMSKYVINGVWLVGIVCLLHFRYDMISDADF